LTLAGAGVDHLGVPLNESSQLAWEVRQHHANHFHPFLAENTLGNNFTITEAPFPEDFFAAGNSYLEIMLTGTDNNGIPTTVSRNVLPRTVNISFDSEPSGLRVTLDDEILTMPQQILTWENHKLRVNVTSVQGDFMFKGWRNNAVTNGEITVPASSNDILQCVAEFELPGTEDTEDVIRPVSAPESVPAPMSLLYPAPIPGRSPPHVPVRTGHFPILEVLTISPTAKGKVEEPNAELDDEDFVFSGKTASSSLGLPLLRSCGLLTVAHLIHAQLNGHI
jgi:hypothetical protein